MDFKTIERVPIVSTGTYKLGSGETTFTADDLAAAVLAANDQTVSAPRIKIGHHDQRFESDPALDGEPAMGTVRNMTLSEDGQTIIADLADVPAWLADSMQSAYPGRSIEGGFGYTAPSGHTYDFVVSDLALLGTTWPGVGSLADLRDVLERNGTVSDAVQASAEKFVSVQASARGELDAEDEPEILALMREGKTRPEAEAIVRNSADERNEERDRERKAPKVAAALDVGVIPRTFAADLRAGRISGLQDGAWPRSVEAADDGALTILVDEAGKLLRVPITVAEKALTYGDPVPVAAAHGPLADLKGPRVLASWPSIDSATGPEERNTMKLDIDVDKSKLIAALGLSEDADEDAIHAKLGVEKAPETTTTPAPQTPVAASGAALPDGVVAIDAARLAELEAKANAGADVAEREAKRAQEEAITAAIGEGRIVASSADTWRQRFAKAPEEAHKLLTASVEDGGLAAVIPVRERGTAGTGETDVSASAPRLFTELNDKTEVAA